MTRRPDSPSRLCRYLKHDAILDALVTALLFVPPAVVLVINLTLCCPKICTKVPNAPLLAPTMRSVKANGGDDAAGTELRSVNADGDNGNAAEGAGNDGEGTPNRSGGIFE
jgi:hypothetical protein